MRNLVQEFDNWYDGKYGPPKPDDTPDDVRMRWRCWQSWQESVASHNRATDSATEEIFGKVAISGAGNVEKALSAIDGLMALGIEENWYAAPFPEMPPGVEVKHLETGLVVRCGVHKGYWQNRERALRGLCRLLAKRDAGESLVPRTYYAGRDIM